MDAAVGYAVALQETADLDLVSDGEWRRHAYTHVIADIAHGFSPDPRSGRWGISVTEPLEVMRPGLIAEEARFLVEATDRATKVCIPSPYLLGVRLWDAELSAAAYPTRDSFIEALVPVLHREAELLAGAGVSVVQIDEPHLCVLVDPGVRATFEDPQYEMDLAADKINEVLHGISGPRTAAAPVPEKLGPRRVGEPRGGYGPIIGIDEANRGRPVRHGVQHSSSRRPRDTEGDAGGVADRAGGASSAASRRSTRRRR